MASPLSASTTRAVMRRRGPDALKASDDGQIEVQLGAQHRKIGPAAPHRLDHAHAIDDAERRRRAQVVGHRLGDAGRQPRQLASPLTLAKSSTAIAGCGQDSPLGAAPAAADACAGSRTAVRPSPPAR